MSSSREKSTSPTLESSPNPSLPDDLLLSCFARVSRLYYPTLSLVSKSCRSLIASSEIYKTRSFLNRTESCLYVCLEIPKPRWFTLCRKPNQTVDCQYQMWHEVKKKKKKSSEYVMVPVPVPNSPPAHCTGLVAVGSNIYAIGRSIENALSSSVSILDCRSHTWHEAPSMQIERNYPAASVVDGRIYVVGGFRNFNSNWMEVFDIKTQTWELGMSPLEERCGIRLHNNVIEGEIYLFGGKGVVYKPKEDKWQYIREHNNMTEGMHFLSCCVIDNVLYCYHHGKITWYDSKIRFWRDLRGLEGLSKLAGCYVKLADYGGKMAVLWDSNILASSGYKKKISFAVISL